MLRQKLANTSSNAAMKKKKKNTNNRRQPCATVLASVQNSICQTKSSDRRANAVHAPYQEDKRPMPRQKSNKCKPNKGLLMPNTAKEAKEKRKKAIKKKQKQNKTKDNEGSQLKQGKKYRVE